MILHAGSRRQATGVLLLPFAVLLLSGCQKDTDPGPGGVTVGEARALDEAAAMLEKRPTPPLADATVPADLAPADLATVPATVAPEAKAPAKAPAKAAPKPGAKPKP